MRSPLRRASVFDDVLYAQCWEDPSIDREAFGIGPSDSVFTITSGGCNTLAFLLDDPRSIVALDLNPHQNHLLELKSAAVRMLSYGDLLGFHGVIESTNRAALYRRLRPSLSDSARYFWDGKPEHIDRGIIDCGRFEEYVRMIGSCARTLLGRDVVWSFFENRSREERAVLYETHWNTRRWRFLTRTLLSRTCMSLFFDKGFFAQLDEHFSFGKHFEAIIRRAMIDLPVHQSPFLSYALLGCFRSHDSLPVYLREDHVPVIRQRLDRITTVSGDCGEYFASLPAHTFSCFNFTNIFEWMSVEQYWDLLGETIRIARPDARMTYRNLLVRRSRPEHFAQSITPQPELSTRLHARDVSFLYKAYIVEAIHP